MPMSFFFVEVALLGGIWNSVSLFYSDIARDIGSEADTAVFYSISIASKDWIVFSFGYSLIKQVVAGFFFKVSNLPNP